jgi:hypothetical protein
VFGSLANRHYNRSLRCAQAGPHRENTLIHALYEVSTPGHPKYVFSATPFLTHVVRTHVSAADIVPTYPGSRSRSLSAPRTRILSSFIPGSSTAACPSLLPQRHTVAAR